MTDYGILPQVTGNTNLCTELARACHGSKSSLTFSGEACPWETLVAIPPETVGFQNHCAVLFGLLREWTAKNCMHLQPSVPKKGRGMDWNWAEARRNFMFWWSIRSEGCFGRSWFQSRMYLHTGIYVFKKCTVYRCIVHCGILFGVRLHSDCKLYMKIYCGNIAYYKTHKSSCSFCRIVFRFVERRMEACGLPASRSLLRSLLLRLAELELPKPKGRGAVAGLFWDYLQRWTLRDDEVDNVFKII